MKLYCLECEIGPDEDYYCSYINLDYVLCIEMFYNEDKQEKYGDREILLTMTDLFSAMFGGVSIVISGESE